MLFPTNSVKALKAIRDSTKNLEILLVGMSTNESIEISRIQETKPVVNAWAGCMTQHNHQSLEIPRQRPRKPNNDDDGNDDIYNNYYYYYHFTANIQDDWR